MHQESRLFFKKIFIKLLLMCISLSGVLLSVMETPINLDNLFFFTIQSNILVFLTAAVCLILDTYSYITLRKFNNSKLYHLKYLVVINITVTFFVFSCFIAPFYPVEMLFTYKNLSVHLFSPLIALFDFYYFDYNFNIQKKSYLLGAIYPLIYAIVILSLSTNGKTYNGQAVPYPFLDYTYLSWFDISVSNHHFGVFYIMIFACLLIIGLSFLLEKFIIMRKKSVLTGSDKVIYKL